MIPFLDFAFGLAAEAERGAELDRQLAALNRRSRAERSAFHAEHFGSPMERRAFARERELNARIERISQPNNQTKDSQ